MKTFDRERFLNFGRYDMTINKAFYRNMLLGILGGALGITLTGFYLRWLLWRGVEEGLEAMGITVEQMLNGDTMMDPWNLYISQIGTELSLLGFLAMMIVVASACWAHNLRNKQGRIMELTIPATNTEKFAWHLLITVGGGILASLCAIVCCDLVNQGLALAFFPHERLVGSFTLDIFRQIFGTVEDSAKTIPELETLMHDSIGIVACCYIATIAIYVLGNAIKYKYNIILTYIVLQVLSSIIGFSSIAFLISVDMNRSLSRGDAQTSASILYWTLCIGLLIVAALSLIFSYKLYTKAQITSKRNK